MLAKPHPLMARALNMQYALGAFNASNLEFAQAIIWGAADVGAPVIIQTSAGALQYAGLRQIAALIRSLAEDAPVPVVLHLDHGRDLAAVKSCIDAGYTSVMIDASAYDFEENIRRTKEVVDYAHERGVWVEAELGALLGAEGAKELQGKKMPDEYLTDPLEAARFVEATGADALAVAVGTIHGAFTGQEYVRFELLDEIEQTVPHVPLVLHGASGIASAHLQQAAGTNVCKINVDTELRLAFEQAVKTYFGTTHDKVDPREMLAPGRDAVQHVVREKLELFGAAGQAAM